MTKNAHKDTLGELNLKLNKDIQLYKIILICPVKLFPIPSIIESFTGDNLFGVIRRENEIGLPKIFILYFENLQFFSLNSNKIRKKVIVFLNKHSMMPNRLYYEMHFGM